MANEYECDACEVSVDTEEELNEHTQAAHDTD